MFEATAIDTDNIDNTDDTDDTDTVNDTIDIDNTVDNDIDDTEDVNGSWNLEVKSENREFAAVAKKVGGCDENKNGASFRTVLSNIERSRPE